MVSYTEENYLKALYYLTEQHGEARLSDLSKAMDVSTPTANSMVKNLKAKDLVGYEKYQPISLTEMGRKLAARVIRKHRLTEMFLFEKMGFGWEEVHEIAEQLEHLQSGKFFDRMDELLSFPRFDPHGSPIPDKEGNTVATAFTPLSRIEPGRSVELAALGRTSGDFLKYLNRRKLKLGSLISVHAIEPFDGTMEISLNGVDRETISKAVSENLLVKEVSEAATV